MCKNKTTNNYLQVLKSHVSKCKSFSPFGFFNAIILPHHPLKIDVSKLFRFHLDTLADDHFEPHNCLEKLQVVIFVVVVYMCYIVILGKLSYFTVF